MRILILTILSLIHFGLNAQTSTDSLQFVQFFFQNGQVSSEGFIRENKPDGYWKTYYESGQLKSEGNRSNFELDGLWKFYNEDGNPVLKVTYKNGLKHGKRITYTEENIIEEEFVDDIKEGNTVTYYLNGKTKQILLFVNGLEEGMSKEYDKNGLVQVIYQYRRGILLNRQFINRTNHAGNKHGIWMDFHNTGNIKIEKTYRNGVKDGFVKYYGENGNLLKIEKFVNGELQIDAEETKEYEIRYDYFPNGRVRIVGSYFEGLPDGVRREYNQEGQIERGYIFRNGRIIAEGIVDEQGRKQGEFTEYYENGITMAEGRYVNSVKVGDWLYYYPDGTIEQKGRHDNRGRQDGEWKWFYNNGQIWKEEEFINGSREGKYIEYDINGKVIAHGTYIDNSEAGFWFYEIGDTREEGKYIDGEFDGIWKTIDIESGIKIFERKYLDGIYNGRQTLYWENGAKRIEGNYIMGNREGDWRYYDITGQLVLRVGYRSGIEISYQRIMLSEFDRN